MSEYRQYPVPRETSASDTDLRNVQHMSSQGSNSYQAYVPADVRREASHYRQDDNRKKKKKRGGVWLFVFWTALIVFLASVITLAVIAYSYYSQQKAYEEVAAVGFTPEAGSTLEDMQVDWDALRAINPDTVAWVYIPGTVVNYPVVQASNNATYLHLNFFGEETWPSTGAIFLDYENNPDFSDPNNILYGHNMLDGSMFQCLDAFRDSAEFNSHRTIYVLTPYGNYRLTSFTLVVVKGTETIAQTAFSSDEEKTTYIQDKINRCEVAVDGNVIPVSEMEKIFMLSTCSHVINNGRAVLFAYVAESTAASDSYKQDDTATIDPNDVAAVDNAAKEIQ